MKRDCLLAAMAVMLSSLAAFAAEGLDQRIAKVLALKGGEVSSLTATLHTNADPEGKDPLAIWRAEAKEKVDLKDAFVRVDFTLVPEKGCDIKCRAEMPLPEKWDGRMWGQGNSGRAGSLPSLKGYIASGTAAVTTDLGTSAFARKDKLVPWPACVLRDFHWRATHLMTVYGKRIVEAFYGKPPSKSYFAGGSTGGRQAMSEAIRFPEDYDGMYVVLPDNNAAASEIALWHLWRQTHDAEGRQLFTTNEMRTVADAAVRYRSATDPAPYAGRILADGRFNESEIDGFLALAAKELPSLAEGDKLARLKALYMPLVHEGKCYFNGFAPGTYHGWNMEWHGLVSLAQFLGEKGVTDDTWKRVGWDLIGRYLSERAPEFNAASTDLSAFKARGGKIMMTLGWEDQTVPPGPILDYYEQVCERDGGIEKTREYFRLFCLPGCAHGGGKGRATTGSPSGAVVRKSLMDWREKGVAPKELVFKWRSANLELPVAPYPGLYVKDADGKWRIKEVKRGISRVDSSVRTTATGVGLSQSAPDADGCTAFIVGRKASATGRVIVGHNNDGFGPMKYAILPATDSAPALNEPGRTGGLGGGKSPSLYWQAVCSDKAKSGKATGDVLLNEYGVIMFSNSGGFMREWGGRKSELPEEAEAATVDGGIGLALRFEVVHRARSAAEGVRIATAFIDRYGYGPDARTFTIADRDEAWILCAVKGRRYVARRCPDDSVMAFPNILPVGRILPGDIVSKGIEAKRDTFDFAAAYQGVRTKHDPSQRHRIAEFYRTTAGVDVDENVLPWSVKPSHLVAVDDLKRGFSSHAVGPDRVSVHPEEVPDVDWPVCRLRTLESVICRFADSPADAAIFIAPGRPCETKYDEFRPFRDAPPPYFATGAAAEALLSARFLPAPAAVANDRMVQHAQ